MATGTLLGALGGYFAVLSSVQKLCFVREVFRSMEDETWPVEFNTIIKDVLLAAEVDAVSIVEQLEAAKVGAEPRDATMLESLVSLVSLVLDETKRYSVPLTEAEGGGKQLSLAIGVASWAARYARAAQAVEGEAAATRTLPLGKWVKEALKWFFGIGVTVGGGMILYRFWQSTDPMVMLGRFYAGMDAIENRRARDLEACGDDVACQQRVNARHDTVAHAFGNKVLDKPGSSCDMLDTPSGTLIGALVGTGFGWAGMRYIMRWT